MRTVSGERVIAAPAQAIFDVIADPAMHPVIDGSGTVQSPMAGNPARLQMGSRFGMDMRILRPYRISNQVVEFEEGHRIAWSHFGGARWRYELEPVAGGTRVRETFDYSQMTVPFAPLLLEVAGFPRRNRLGIERTLDRLVDLVVAGRQ